MVSEVENHTVSVSELVATLTEKTVVGVFDNTNIIKGCIKTQAQVLHGTCYTDCLLSYLRLDFVNRRLWSWSRRQESIPKTVVTDSYLFNVSV